MLDARSPAVISVSSSPYISLISHCSLTFVIPIAAYNVSLARLNDTPEDQQYGLINQARLIAFGVMLGVWFFMFLPIAIWKYIVGVDQFFTNSSALK